MRKPNVKMTLAVVSAAALVAACGGRNDDPVAVVDPVTQTGQSVQKTLDYITSLFATSENSDAVDVNAITLAVDDTAEPSAI